MGDIKQVPITCNFRYPAPTYKETAQSGDVTYSDETFSRDYTFNFRQK